MRYRVLGPLRAGGLTPAGEKQRLLLGALLLHAPRPVSGSSLIRTLWGESQPEHPGAALRTQLSRLRAFLTRAGAGDVLGSESHGYRLAIDAEEIDAHGFEQLLRESPDASAGERLVRIESALGLWSGEAYEDVADAHVFAGEVARLNGLRVSALETRVECLLTLRRVDDAIVAAERLVAREPLRERPRALLMRALYAAGRHVEALNTFHDFRRLLSTELGLDPSPALRTLETQLIRHDAEPPALGRISPTIRPPPRPLTRLIGREREVEQLERLLRSVRLVTLTGAGGSGKTRLALEIPRLLQARTCVWIPLDGLLPGADPLPALAETIGVRESPGRELLDTVLAALHQADALLVFDNCEHVVEGCAALIETLLRACPALGVLATSREPLRVPGEATLAVPPLAVPSDDDARTDCAAVELFVERASAALPTFALDDANAVLVAHICRRLDGIPLAIEFAAARLRSLPLEVITDRLDDRLALLTSGTRTAPARHRTLRAVIEWSHDLLTHGERAALAQLAVFAGGFTLHAAEHVVAADEPVLDLVASLVEKSLVMADPAERDRFRLLDVVRAFALEQLAANDGARDARQRHAAYFASLAESAEPHLLGARRTEWIARLAAEQDNLRAALAWTLADEHALNARLASALWWFAHSRGNVREARDWIESAIARLHDDVDPALRARLLNGGAMAAWIGGDISSAARHAHDALAAARSAGAPQPLVHALCVSAWIARDSGDLATATRLADDAALVAHDAPLPPAELGFALWHQGSIHYTAGNLDAARDAQEQALALWRAEGVSWGTSQVLHGLAIIALDEGRLADAAQLCRDAIAALRDDTDVYWICRVLEGLGAVLARQGDVTRAARLLGAADGLRAPIGAPLLAFETPRHDLTLDLLRRAMTPEELASQYERGRTLSLDAALDLARASRPADA